MAVPKRKSSKMRRNTRSAHYVAASANLTRCPNCHELKPTHVACANCGYYGDKKVIEVEENK